jgi:O-antigen/teichoic acid export membrane protein
VAQPIYTWLFGLATYGLYFALWGAVNLLSNIVDLSMTSALQRIVPAEDEETRVAPWSNPPSWLHLCPRSCSLR